MKFFVIGMAILAIVGTTRCDEATKRIANTGEAVPDVTSIENEEAKETSDVPRKRDAGYAYPRPIGDTSRTRNLADAWTPRIRPSLRTHVHQARPFTRYGSPRQPQRNEIQVTVNAAGANGGDGRTQRVPYPIREQEFVAANPIASQNNVPFGPNTANYLPPRNQKLPVYEAPSASNEHGNRHQNQQSHLIRQNHYNHHPQSIRVEQALPSRPTDYHISDGVEFLAHNSQAIEQLYAAPAIDVSYEPNREHDFTRDSSSLEITGNQENHRDKEEFRLPAYASGLLDREALRNVKALEKDRLINELRQSLVNAQRERLNFTPDVNEASQENRENAAGRAGPCAPGAQSGFVPIAPTSGYAYNPPLPVNAPTSGHGSQETSGNNAAASSTSSTSTTGATNNFQFPQFGTVLPITTNFYPSYGTNLLASGTTSQSTAPTQFGIPIPQNNAGSAQKPTTPGEASNQYPITVQTLTPVLGTAGTSSSPTALQPSFPLVPAIGQNGLTHPSHVIQQTVNPLIVKPVKPLYPLYYYPNVYQLQKPGLTALPWNYAPSYAPVRTDQAWK